MTATAVDENRLRTILTLGLGRLLAVRAPLGHHVAHLSDELLTTRGDRELGLTVAALQAERLDAVGLTLLAAAVAAYRVRPVTLPVLVLLLNGEAELGLAVATGEEDILGGVCLVLSRLRLHGLRLGSLDCIHLLAEIGELLGDGADAVVGRCVLGRQGVELVELSGAHGDELRDSERHCVVL